MLFASQLYTRAIVQLAILRNGFLYLCFNSIKIHENNQKNKYTSMNPSSSYLNDITIIT